MRFRSSELALLLWPVVACTRDKDEGARRQAPPLPPAAAVALDTAVPDGQLGVSIRRGRALMNSTRDSLPRHVGNTLKCTSCHLDDGLRLHAMPFIGVYSRFPQFRPRNGRVNVIEDRINDCFERSMNGTGLAFNGRDMRDIVAYMAFLSRGIAPPGEVPGQGTKPLAPHIPGDTVFGREVFDKSCSKCHGASGEGTAVAPALWGKSSYSIGAGMARARTAAAFIRQTMPFDQPGTLTDAQAANVAAYVNSRPRPDFRGKENDWPNGDPPPDAAYPTRAATQRPTKSSTQ